MSKPVSNVDILLDKWFNLVNKVNQVSYVISNEAITANSSLGVTGNSSVQSHGLLYGSFTANILYTETLQGGNSSFVSDLKVQSNISVGNNFAISTTTPTGNSVYSGNSITFSYGTDTITYNANGITSNTYSINSNTTIRDLKVSNNFSVESNKQMLANSFLTEYSSNTNLGANNAPKRIYSFDKSVYDSGKLLIKLKNQSNTQLSEMLLTHNTTDVQMTVYGSVSSPPGANSSQNTLGSYTAVVNNSLIEVYVTQVLANTSVNVVANLVKG